MGRGLNKDKSIDVQSVKQILGRIFRLRHHFEEHLAQNTGHDVPFLLIKERTVRVPLEQVIAAIAENPLCADQEIVGKIGVAGIKPSDIEMVRAYMHRFGNDVGRPLRIEQHAAPTLLLDENTPQSAIVPLSKTFGWATHVSAEGLAGRDTPDEDIWDFASHHQFAAIVTRDTDFFYIQKHQGDAAKAKSKHVPLLIFVPEALSSDSLCDLFETYADDVRYHLRAKSLGCSLAKEAGCHELHLK